MKNVLDDILALSVAERLLLVEDIWDSIVATPEAVPVTDAQRKELARRKRAHESLLRDYTQTVLESAGEPDLYADDHSTG